MTWKPDGKYALRNGTWTIAKYGKVPKYVLWQDKGPDNRVWIAGPFDTADEAKDEWQKQVSANKPLRST